MRFTNRRHRVIHAAIRACQAEGLRADVDGVAKRLARWELLDQAGGIEYLRSCVAAAHTWIGGSVARPEAK